MGTLKVLWFFLAWALFFQEGTAAVDYCNPEAPLTTEYFVPFYEESRTVKGCFSSELNSENGFKVVVVRTKITSGDVLLTLADISTKGVVIILDSPVPIRWRLSFYRSTDEKHERHVVMTPGSTLVETDANVKNLDDEYNKIQVDPSMPDEKFGTLVRQYYGGLTVLAQVVEANRVSLSLSDKAAKKVPSECNLDSLVPLTDSVLAFFVHKQKMYGCFHANIAGTMSTDVHVIDLMAATPSAKIPLNNLEDNGEDQRFSRATAQSNQLPAVFLSMTPKITKSGKIIDNSPRNITLILKSAYPVKWYLESWKMKGHLTVISTSQVVKDGLSPDQQLTVETRPIISGLSADQKAKLSPYDAQLQMWKSIVSDTGATPMSYIKVKVANILQMVIPPKAQVRVGNRADFTTTQDNFKANFVPDPLSLDDAPVADTGYAASPVIPEKAFGRNSETDLKIPGLEKDLEDLVSKKCDQSETIVTLPIESLAKFNVTDMALNEAGCRAEKNASHWILKTKSTSCGSLNAFIGNNPIMNNAIHLEFFPGSEFHGKSVRVPFTCKFPPGWYGMSTVDDNINVNDDYDDDEDEAEDEMYTMKVMRKKKHTKLPQVLVARPDDHATVFVGDHLKVQTDFKTRLPASLMIEKCWISNHADAVDRSLDTGKFLIYEGCPANKNVTMLPVPYGTNPSFTFAVNAEHRRMGQIYIFCVLGLCTPVKSLTAGNLIECVDPTQKCAEDNDEWHVGPAAQQLSRRGPLYVTDQRLEVKFDSPNLPHEAQKHSKKLEEFPPQESPGLHSSHVVMVGVPAEIAVAISLASFLIGAALTGMLCRIHQRRSLKKSETRNSRTDHHLPHHDSHETQPMVALASPTNNGQSLMKTSHHHHSAMKLDGANA